MTILTPEVRQKVLDIVRTRGGLNYGAFGKPGECRCFAGAVMEATGNDVYVGSVVSATLLGVLTLRGCDTELGFESTLDLYRWSDKTAVKPFELQVKAVAELLGIPNG